MSIRRFLFELLSFLLPNFPVKLSKQASKQARQNPLKLFSAVIMDKCLILSNNFCNNLSQEMKDKTRNLLKPMY